MCQQKFTYRKKKRKLKTLLSPPSTPQRSLDISISTASILSAQLNPGTGRIHDTQDTLSPLRFAARLSHKFGTPISRPKSVSHLSAVSEDLDASSAPYSPEDCPVSPLRVHEAAVILKDNDLKVRAVNIHFSIHVTVHASRYGHLAVLILACR